jgi:hypothetical protein
MRLLVLVVIEVFGRWVTSLPVCLSACLSVGLSACVPACLPACLSSNTLCLCRSLAPFVQLHLFIFVFLLSAMVSLLLKPHKFAAVLDAFTLSGFALIMFLSQVRGVQTSDGSFRSAVL